MPRPKRDIQAVAQETVSPPDSLIGAQSIARVKQAMGNNLYQLELAIGGVVLAELSARFRSTIWVKRGSYVVFDHAALANRANKLDGEIVNVVRDERAWKKMAYWPAEFSAKKVTHEGDSDENGPMMPPSDSEG